MAPNYYLGLMAGTSLDGVNAALVDAAATKLSAQFYQPYPAKLKKTLRTLTQSGQTNLQNLALLDIQIANFFADSANALLANTNISKTSVVAIGSHGQTIYHQGGVYSMQIGHGALIAERTQIQVVADFRMNDIAANGQGAPLTPLYHQNLLNGRNGVVLNLGGIANLTRVIDNQTTGFDTGPANTLMDNWIYQHKQLDYDKDGLWARQGTVDKALLKHLLADNYFQKPAPKSSGVEYFNLNWLAAHLKGNENIIDIQTTLLELSALSISAHLLPEDTVYLCGGGAHNLFLYERLEALNQQCKITTTADLGMPPDCVEAAAFAFFAQQTLNAIPSNLPQITGANSHRILGAIYAAP